MSSICWNISFINYVKSQQGQKTTTRFVELFCCQLDDERKVKTSMTSLDDD